MKSSAKYSLVCPLDPSALGPEFELLLSCCRPKPSAIDYQRQQQLAKQGLNTAKVLELGIRHKISPLLYSNLAAHPAGTFDADLLAALKVRHQENTQYAFKALQATHELARATPPLQLIGLKGLDVAIRAYKDIAVRHVGDIDILVAPQDFDAFLARLQQQGWWTPTPEYTEGKTRKILALSRHECSFYREYYPSLELHWRLTANPYEFPIREWLNAPQSLGAGTGIAGLNNEDLLIYLCMHGAAHGWGRLKWLFDIPNVVETCAINWSQMWQKAHRLGVGFTVQYSLLLAKKYCAMHWNSEIEAGFQYRISNVHWASILKYQQGPELWMELPPANLSIHRWITRLTSAKKIKTLTWYLGLAFFPHLEDVRKIKVPASAHWLYFPIHPFMWFISRMQSKKVRESREGGSAN